jgi:hypothetical protein
MNNEMSWDERRDLEEQRQKALKEFVQGCRARGMSLDEMKAELRAANVRMKNLNEEGFTLEQAEEIILKEEEER